jgi:hypothetical protein
LNSRFAQKNLIEERKEGETKNKNSKNKIKTKQKSYKQNIIMEKK